MEFLTLVVVVSLATFGQQTQASKLPPDPTNPHGSRHCVIRGDPHIFQFDAGKFNPAQGIYVTGTCDYILVKTNCSTPYHNPEFIVTGAFRQDPLNPTHSSLHRVDASIIIDSKNWGLTIPKGLGNIILFNRTVYPTSLGSAAHLESIGGHHYRGNSIEIMTGSSLGPDWRPAASVAVATFSNGAKVMYDGFMQAMIYLPYNMQGMVCGACGNFDGVFGNDRGIGYMCKNNGGYDGVKKCSKLMQNANFGEQEKTDDKFIDSWFYGGADGGTCKHECGV